MCAARLPYFPGTVVKCLARSACGRGMTWTETSVPTLLAASEPASVAAFTAPTSPLMMTATRPLVSIMPIALDMAFSVLLVLGLLLLWLRAGLVQRADDERVDRDLAAAEP